MVGLAGLGGLAAGLTQAPLAPTEGREMGTQRADAREAFRQKQRQQELQYQRDSLAHQQEQRLAEPQTDAMLDMLQQQRNETRKLGSALVRNASYSATDAYLEDWDVKHFDNFFKDMKDNPFAPEEFKNIVRVDRLRPQDEDHKALVNSLGISEQQLDEMDGEVDGNIDWDTISKRFVVMTRPDGTQDLRDVYQFGILSGYADYTNARKLKELKTLADVRRRQPGGESELAMIRKARAVAEARERIARGEGTQFDKEIVQFGEAEQGGTKPFHRAKADEARTRLDESGVDIYSMNPDDILAEKTPETRAIMEDIRAIEAQAKLDATAKKTVEKARKSVSSLKRAINLDPDTHGFVDSWLAGLKRYFSDNVPGQEATTAYNHWMNQVRNDLFGVAVSEMEFKMFRQAYGSEKQAMTMALHGLSELASDLEASLESLQSMNDPRVAYVRFGKTQQELRTAMRNLNARITYYRTYEQAKDNKKSDLQAQEEARKAAGYIVDSRGMATLASEWDVPSQRQSGPAQPASRKQELQDSFWAPVGGSK